MTTSNPPDRQKTMCVVKVQLEALTERQCGPR
jgi:hypothetical protein